MLLEECLHDLLSDGGLHVWLRGDTHFDNAFDFRRAGSWIVQGPGIQQLLKPQTLNPSKCGHLSSSTRSLCYRQPESPVPPNLGNGFEPIIRYGIFLI